MVVHSFYFQPTSSTRSIIKFQLRTFPLFANFHASHVLDWTTRPKCSITIYVCSISPCRTRVVSRHFSSTTIPSNIIIIDTRLVRLIKCQVQSLLLRKSKTASTGRNISILYWYISSLTGRSTHENFSSPTIRDQNEKIVTRSWFILC